MTTNTTLEERLNSLQGDLYDTLTLNRERINQLSTLIDLAYRAVSNDNKPQAMDLLRIGQHLSLDFLESIKGEIAATEEEYKALTS